MAESRYHFEKLTPTDDIDLTVYEDAFNYIFENSDVRNVAVSGAYSAGKSSVLASYKKKHSDLRFLHISLAHFKSPDQGNEDKAETKAETKETAKTGAKESVLEGKILNQLIHQIPSEKIPQTNFRVKKKISPQSIIKETIRIALLLAAILYFVFFDVWQDYVSSLPDNWLKSMLSPSAHQYALIADGFLMIGLFAFLVYGLIKLQKNKNVFHKLNFQGNEIEIFEESDDSYFDKYLNEVLYLFENADADVIVFEDMDRFPANKIFERLREVNTLVNIQLQKENKSVLRFFYLLRDDIFISKDRTKFFDYIIPIIPVVDSSNSYDQFISHLKNNGLFEKLDDNFLQGLSLYIDDMRLLKNICNEFVVYYNRLNTIELDCNKMLAIITYKNLFPRDFSALQLNQGFVYTLFDKKDSFISQEVEKLEGQISDKNNELHLAKTNHIKSIHQLNVIFAHEYLNDYTWYGYNSEELQKFVSEYLRGDGLAEYSNAKRILEIDISQRKEEIHVLERKLVELGDKQLSEIITRDNIDSIFSTTRENEIGDVAEFNEVKGSEYFDLLKYLIRNGHIDETYVDYMSYFYENSLNRIDKIFLRSITDKKAKEYTYKLNNPELVISYLRLKDFDQEEILNFDLFTHLLKTSRVDYIERLIDQLKNTKNFKFIGAYFDATVELAAYIKHLNRRWPEVFLTALNEQLMTETQMRKYSIASLYHSDDDILALVNQDNCLCDYISNARDYLAIDNPNIDRLLHCFTLLGVCFIGFDYAKLNKRLFHAVYEQSLYKINDENLRLIQQEILGIRNEDDFLHGNYTILCANPDSAITQYVSQNINVYFDVVLKMSEGIIDDKENVAIAVLNNSELTIEHKQSYVSALWTIITSIKEITDRSLWPSLLDADTVWCSELNIVEYFNVFKLDKSIIAYISRWDVDLDFSKMEYDKNTKKELFDSVIICDAIENVKYEQILMSLGFACNNFDITDISDDKITILLDAGIVRMTAANLEFIRENYPEQKSYFIHKNIKEYVDIMDAVLFSREELLEMLDWEISDELKIKLLKFSSSEISVIGKNYSSAVCLHILNNNLMRSDLFDLFSTFEQWNDSVQTKIFDYAVENMADIIDNPKSVSEKLKNNLFHSGRISRGVKINLLIAMMPDLSEDDIKEILTLINLNDYLRIFNPRSRPMFKINDENVKLLSAFKARKLIRSYEESSQREGYYKIVKSKPKKLLSKE